MSSNTSSQPKVTQLQLTEANPEMGAEVETAKIRMTQVTLTLLA